MANPAPTDDIPPAATPAATPAANLSAATDIQDPSAQPPVNQPIEADPQLTESDSALGDEVSRYTASLTSSIERYTVENGRRYHAFKEGSYVMPNDDLELDRLDLFHQLVKIVMLNKLHFCPLPKDRPTKILDVGTGTGIWAIEMGDEYPLAEVLGIDLSPTQTHWVPTNVKFEVDDCEAEWAFQHKFDLIHLRYMAGALKDWPNMVRQCSENTVPGGWTELQDFDLLYRAEDGSLPDDAPLNRWIRTLLGASRDFGNDPCPGENLGQWLVDSGFEDVHVDRFPVPIGPWPKDRHLKTIGAWNLVEIEDGLEGFTLRLFTQQLGWKPEEVQVLLAKVRKDLRNPRIHALFYLFVARGRKPLNPTTTATAPPPGQA